MGHNICYICWGVCGFEGECLLSMHPNQTKQTFAKQALVFVQRLGPGLLLLVFSRERIRDASIESLSHSVSLWL